MRKEMPTDQLLPGQTIRYLYKDELVGIVAPGTPAAGQCKAGGGLYR